jgi:DNA-binding NarL/FixJ family response regulator
MVEEGARPRAPTRVLVADDQRIFASMLAPVLASDQGVEVVGQVRTVVVKLG